MDRRSWRRPAAGALATALTMTGLGLAATPAHAATACDVRYVLISEWPGGFTAGMTIRNLGSEAWSGWSLRFRFPGDQRVTGGWNGRFQQGAGSNEVTVTNQPYNGSVPPGGQVSSIGFYGTFTGSNRPPTNFAVNDVWCFGAPLRPVVAPAALTVPEGGSASISVRLSAAPTTNTTVHLQAGLGGTFRFAGELIQTSLTFTPANWNVPQAVAVFSDEDPDFDANTDTVYVSVGAETTTVALTQADNDDPNAPTLVYTPDSTLNSFVPEGGYRSFGVRLSRAPTTGPVTVRVSRVSGDADLTAAPATLTFTAANWNVDQRVVVSAAEDADAASMLAEFRLSPDRGVGSLDVFWYERDNDTQGLVVTPTALAVPEGGTATYRVRLRAQPPGGIVPVQIETNGGDTDLTVVSGASLTFTTTNWNVDQLVTVAAAEDPDADAGTRAFTVVSRTTQGSLPSVGVTATEVDND